MLTGLNFDYHTHLSCSRNNRRYQTHRPAVIGACAVTAPDASHAGSETYSDNFSTHSSDRVRKVAGLQRALTKSAADSQQDGGRYCRPACKQAYGHAPPRSVRWSHLHARLLNSLRQQPHLLPQGSKVLVAVSGGQDSMALLRLLIDLQRESSKHKTALWPLQLVVGHCDHNMRVDSARNAEFVREQTLRMGRALGFGQISVTSQEQHSMHIVMSDTSQAPDVLRSMLAPLVTSSPYEVFSNMQPQIVDMQIDGQSDTSRDLQETQDWPRTGVEQRQGVQQQQTQQVKLQACLSQDMQLQQPELCRGQQFVAAACLEKDPSKQLLQWSNRHKVRRTGLQQNRDSAEIECSVHEQADKLRLQYTARTAEQGLRSEAEARDWRHQMLAQMAAEAECTHIVLGHTATDRAETLLFNLIRGAGPSGVSSMGWSRNTGDEGLQLVRPLLDFTREETAEVCKITGTEVYEDSTNADVQYSRNRLRLLVFPHLTAINTQAVQHMVQTCELLQADSSFLDSLADHHLQQAVQLCKLRRCKAARDACSEGGQAKQVLQQAAEQQTVKGLPVLNTAVTGVPSGSADETVCQALPVEQLCQIPKALRYRVIHSWLQQQPVVIAPSYRMVSEVESLLQGHRAKTCRTSTLCGELTAVRHRGLLLVVHNDLAAGLLAGRLEVLDVVGEQQYKHHWQEKQL